RPLPDSACSVSSALLSFPLPHAPLRALHSFPTRRSSDLTRAAAGPFLEADDAFHGLHVPETPLAVQIFNIYKFLKHLVQFKVLIRIEVDLPERLFDRFVRHIIFGDIT